MTGLQTTVEVGFSSGFKTAAADIVWDDVADRVEGPITINHGRQDERQAADANTCSLRLDNADGALTPVRGSLVPAIPLYCPIRVTVEPPETPGVPMDRFYGFVTGWELGWDVVSESAYVEVTAASRLGRLGRVRPSRSVIEETLLPLGPVAYWTLGDPDGSIAAAESSGRGVRPAAMTGAGAVVVFGTATGPATDDLTAAQFAGGRYLSVPHLTVPAPWSISAWFSTSATGDLVGVGPITLGVVFGGDLWGSVPGFVVEASSVADSATHHAVLTHATDLSLNLYLDGALVDTATLGAARDIDAAVLLGRGYTGVLAHVGLFEHDLDADEVDALYLSGSTGFAGETSGDRLVRYAPWAGVPAADVTSEGMTRTVAHVDPTGKSVVELAQALAATEDGVVYDTRSGGLRAVGGSLRYTAEPAVTLDMAEQQVEADFSPQYSPDTIVNIATVTPPESVGAAATIEDAASRDAYGDSSPTTTDTISDDPNDASNMAGWLLARYAQPSARLPQVSVDVLVQADSTPSAEDLMLLDIGSRVVIENQPEQAPSETGDYFVEGYTENIWTYAYSTTLNLSPAEPYTNVLILNDPVRGELDAGYVLGF